MKKPFNVIYEDNHLLVVNKAAGILVQGDKTGDKTLTDLCKTYIANKYNKPGAVFLHQRGIRKINALADKRF